MNNIFEDRRHAFLYWNSLVLSGTLSILLTIQMLKVLSQNNVQHKMPLLNVRFRNFSTLVDISASSHWSHQNRQSREEREERVHNAMRIVRVGNQRVRCYVIDSAPQPPTPPPGYAHHDPVLVTQEINHRPDVIAEG